MSDCGVVFPTEIGLKVTLSEEPKRRTSILGRDVASSDGHKWPIADLVVKDQMSYRAVKNNNPKPGWLFIFLFVCRERRPTSVWRWTALAAPATVAPDPVAVARAGHAATRRAAARARRATLHAVPAPVLAPVPAPRFLFVMAAGLLGAGDGNRHDLYTIQCILMDGVMLCSPSFVLLLFCFHFYIRFGFLSVCHSFSDHLFTFLLHFPLDCPLFV